MVLYSLLFCDTPSWAVEVVGTDVLQGSDCGVGMPRRDDPARSERPAAVHYFPTAGLHYPLFARVIRHPRAISGRDTRYC
jgi:hypothetical protein